LIIQFDDSDDDSQSDDSNDDSLVQFADWIYFDDDDQLVIMQGKEVARTDYLEKIKTNDEKKLDPKKMALRL
jgi:hypothetical protein